MQWEEGPFPNAYRVRFPEVRIVISREIHDYLLHLVNEKGRITDSLSAVSASLVIPGTVKGLLEEIYESARQQVQEIPSNADKALEYLRKG